MSSQARTALLFAVVLILMLVGAYFYLQRNEGSIVESVPSATQSQAATATSSLPAGIHPNIQTALDALREDHVDEAIGLLEAVPANDPGYPIALQTLGEAYARAGRNEDSLRVLLALARIQPENATVRVGLSLAYYRLGRFDEAEGAVLRAIEIDPDNIPARYDVALYRVAQGRVADAIPAYQRALARDTTRSYLGQAQLDLRGLHLVSRDLPDVHYALAFFDYSLGRREDEVLELQHFLELQPEGPVADNARTRLAEAQKAVESTNPE